MTIDKTPDTIKIMFNCISERYDFMNNIISFGLHKLVKKKSIKLLDIKNEHKIIDLCCGTGDMARIVKENFPQAEVIGCDFSPQMVNLAKQKFKDIQFLCCDSINLPFPDETFDVVLMSFGLRNIYNAEKAVEEVYRILKPNGKFLHIDFGEKNIFSHCFDLISLIFARIFSKNYSAYSYLVKSKREFLSPENLITDFESKGFKLYKREDYMFDVISAQVMIK